MTSESTVTSQTHTKRFRGLEQKSCIFVRRAQTCLFPHLLVSLFYLIEESRFAESSVWQVSLTWTKTGNTTKGSWRSSKDKSHYELESKYFIENWGPSKGPDVITGKCVHLSSISCQAIRTREETVSCQSPEDLLNILFFYWDTSGHPE